MDKSIKQLEVEIEIARNKKKKAITDLWNAKNVIDKNSQIIIECEREIRNLKARGE